MGKVSSPDLIPPTSSAMAKAPAKLAYHWGIDNEASHAVSLRPHGN